MSGFGVRQIDRERRFLTKLALNVQKAPVMGDNVFGDGKAQPGVPMLRDRPLST